MERLLYLPVPRLTLSQFGLAYAIALVAMAILDGFWLGWLARDFYKREMGDLMAESIRIGPAALFYLLYPLGLVYLALQPAPAAAAEAFLRCAVVGLVAYGAYDLTNLAIVRGWSLRLCLADMAWGTAASALAGGVASLLAVPAAARG
jgi:uncharacterized membrane protein